MCLLAWPKGVDCCLQSGTNYAVFDVSVRGHWALCEKTNDPLSGLQRCFGSHIWVERQWIDETCFCLSLFSM